MTGSMTGGVPDYRDPNEDARRLLGSRKRSDREQGRELLQLMEQQQNRQARQQQFDENQQTRQDIHDDRSAQRDIAQRQLNQYREGLSADKEKGLADRETLNLTHLLSDRETNPAVRQAIENHILKQSGISGTSPVDPAKLALVRSKNAELQKQGKPLIPEPKGEAFGGAPTTNSESSTPETGAFSGISRTGYPVLPNTPETSFTGRGHGSLEGSREVAGGIQTPSGGFIGTDITPGVATLTAPRGGAPTSVAGAPTTSAPAPSGEVSGKGMNFGDLLAGKTTEEQRAAGRPDIAGTERPGLGALKSVGSAIGGLFSGGQGGANQLVGGPTPIPGGPTSPPATPAPGTQFQGPLTATAGFLGTPNAPAPQPALTPPAIPPVNKPTPEEERRRLMAAGQ